MNNNISDFLKKKVSLFEHLSENKLDQILKGSKVVSYEPNEAVVRFGEDAGFLGVLVKGKLSASVISENGSRTTIGHFNEGDTFGEMALMSRDKTVADIIAETNCQVLRIPVEIFQSVILTEPTALKKLSKTVAVRF
jgi:CRP/FNR family transcriptional regulator